MRRYFLPLLFALLSPLVLAQENTTVRNGVRYEVPNYPFEWLSVAGVTPGQCLMADSRGRFQGTTCGGGTVSPWAGKNIGFLGDSIFADFASRFQLGVVAANSANTITFNDSRHGRPMSLAFENYTVPAVVGTTTINILNTSTDTANAAIASSPGGANGAGMIVTGVSGYTASDFIDLRGAPTFIANFPLSMYNGNAHGIAFFDASHTFLSGVTAGFDLAANTAVGVPAGAKYVRVHWQNSAVNLSTAMLLTGSVVPGSYQTYDPTTLYTGSSSGGAAVDSAGHTLAQNLAPVDLLIVWLSGNDGGDTLGSPGDPASFPTFYGYTRNVVETLLAAKPTLRLVMVIPFQSNPASINFTPAESAGIATAIKYVSAQSAVPVVDLLTNSGINQFNWLSTLLPDGIHPTNATFDSILIPYVAKAIQRIN